MIFKEVKEKDYLSKKRVSLESLESFFRKNIDNRNEIIKGIDTLLSAKREAAVREYLEIKRKGLPSGSVANKEEVLRNSAAFIKEIEAMEEKLRTGKLDDYLLVNFIDTVVFLGGKEAVLRKKGMKDEAEKLRRDKEIFLEKVRNIKISKEEIVKILGKKEEKENSEK